MSPNVIQRYRPGDSNLPENKGYQQWVEQWVRWAFTNPDVEGDATRHPLKECTGSTAPQYGFCHSPKVMSLGTSWYGQDIPSEGIKRKISVSKGTSLLICGVCTIISPQEFPRQFTNNPSNEEIEIKTRAIMDDSSASIAVSNSNTHLVFPSVSDDPNSTLDRIFLNVRQYHLDANIIPTFPKKSTVNAAVDGYWLFIKELLTGNYKFEIKLDSPVFDSDSPGERFKLDAIYTINVI